MFTSNKKLRVKQHQLPPVHTVDSGLGFCTSTHSALVSVLKDSAGQQKNHISVKLLCRAKSWTSRQRSEKNGGELQK